MPDRRGFTLLQFAAVVGITAAVAALFVPAFAVMDARISQCHENMGSLGKAVKMYMLDWEDTFPTNRLLRPNNKVISPRVPLSDPSLKERYYSAPFQHGVNWVEGLSPYVEKVTIEPPASATWKCPAARNVLGPNQSRFAATTYAFNANLAERSEGDIQNAGVTMMMREMDRLYDAVLRPTNISTSGRTAPKDPFLNQTELGIKGPNYRLHDDGSNVLFTDGHVRLYPVAFFPEKCQWDKATHRWFNYIGPSWGPRNKTIAVTP